MNYTRTLYFTKFTLKDIHWNHIPDYFHWLSSVSIRSMIYLRSGMGQGIEWKDITSHVSTSVGSSSVLDITYPKAIVVSNLDAEKNAHRKIRIQMKESMAERWDLAAMNLNWKSYDILRLIQFLFAKKGTPRKSVICGDASKYTCDEGTLKVIEAVDSGIISPLVYIGLVPESWHFLKYMNKQWIYFEE